MQWLGTITIIGVIVLVGLIVLFMKALSKDRIEEIMNKRRATSKLVTRGEYVEGMERIAVALSVSDDTFYYENSDLEARFELNRLDEIEYDDELATGHHVSQGCGVLRLRAHGAAFDFVLAPEDCKKWQVALPARRINESIPHAV